MIYLPPNYFNSWLLHRGIIQNPRLRKCFSIPIVTDQDADFVQNLLFFSRKIESLIEVLDKLGSVVSVSETYDLYISYMIIVHKLCHIIHPTYLVYDRVEKIHGFENYCFTREKNSFAPGVTREFSNRSFRFLSEIKAKVEKLQQDNGPHRLVKTLRRRWDQTFAAVCAMGKHFPFKDVPDDNLRQVSMIVRKHTSILHSLI